MAIFYEPGCGEVSTLGSGPELMIAFDNTYTSLPEKFYVRVKPEEVSQPQLFAFNEELARKLGLDLSSFSEEQRAALIGGKTPGEAYGQRVRTESGYVLVYLSLGESLADELVAEVKA